MFSIFLTVFLPEQCAVSKVRTSVRSAVFSALTQPHVVLPLVCCPVDNTLLEVSPEIGCSDASSRYCYYGNRATDSHPILF